MLVNPSRTLPAKKSHFHMSACQHLLNDKQFVSVCLNLQILVLLGDVLQRSISTGFCPSQREQRRSHMVLASDIHALFKNL